MKYDAFKEMCNKAWCEKFNYFCIHVTKNKNYGKSRFFNENKNTYIDCFCKTDAFKIF